MTTILHAHSGNLYGGVETVMLTLAQQPGPLHHVFALSYEARLAGRLRGVGAIVEVLGEARFSRPWSVRQSRRRLAAVISQHQPHAVLCHSPWALAAFGPVVREAHIPLVLWARAAFTGRHWLEWLARLTARPDFAICNSEYTRAALPRAFPGIPAEVLYNPVAPPPAFDPARRPTKRDRHGAGPDTVVVALVARLETGKGHRPLLDALTSLRELPGWTAWIVGGAQRRAEDVYRADLERRTNEARITDRVHFLGQRDDVASLLWASDVYCQPNTVAESFGNTLVEALYAGLPVITTDWGGPREVVTPACGILIPPGDGTALREALHRLITDGDLRRGLGAAGPSRAAHLCGPQQVTARLSAILEHVLHRSELPR